MTFINELIPEEDKQRIDWTKFKAWSFSKPHKPWKWTIDRERDVFLIPLVQPGYDDTHTRSDIFALYWKKEVIKVEAKVTGTGEGKFWDILYWKVCKIHIPTHLQIERNEIFNILREAFCTYGRFFNTEHVKTVHVEFACEGV
jgi:hypothetical protein